MVLIGTTCGRIFNYSTQAKAVDSKFGEANFYSDVVFLEHMNATQDQFGHLTASGLFTQHNLYDAFDSKSYTFLDSYLTCGTYDTKSRVLFAGSSSGNIMSLEMNHSNLNQLTKKRSV